MRNILKSDFYKLRVSKMFMICITLCLLIGIVTPIAFESEIQFDLAEDPTDIEALMFTEQTSGVWGLQHFLPLNFHILIIGIFISVFVTSEFTFGTIKNTLSRGAERVNVFLSKVIVCTVGAIIMQMFFIAAILGSGSVIWGYDPNNISTFGSLVRIILQQTLLIIAFSSLFTFLSTAIRSNGGSIAVNIICSTMISTLFNAIGVMFGNRIIVNDYWIGGVVPKMVEFTPVRGDILQGIFVATVWGAASLLVGIILFKKQDVN